MIENQNPICDVVCYDDGTSVIFDFNGRIIRYSDILYEKGKLMAEVLADQCGGALSKLRDTPLWDPCLEELENLGLLQTSIAAPAKRMHIIVPQGIERQLDKGTELQSENARLKFDLTDVDDEDLVVVVSYDGTGNEAANTLDKLHRNRRQHLCVQALPDKLTIGPFVVPGVSSCSNCLTQRHLCALSLATSRTSAKVMGSQKSQRRFDDLNRLVSVLEALDIPSKFPEYVNIVNSIASSPSSCGAQPLFPVSACTRCSI